MEYDTIRYTIRYRVVGIPGIYSFPLLIPTSADPIEYVRKILNDIYPNGYDFIDLTMPIAEVISDEQLELNKKYIDQISSLLGEYKEEK